MLDNLDINAQIELISGSFKYSFEAYCKEVFSIITPETPFKPHYGTSLYIEHHQMLGEGYYKGLICSVPRGFGKSIFSSVLFPAWLLARDSTEKVATFTEKFGSKDEKWHEDFCKIFKSDFSKTFFDKDFQSVSMNKEKLVLGAGGFKSRESCQASSVGMDISTLIMDDVTGEDIQESIAKQEQFNRFLRKGVIPALRTVKYEFDEEHYSQLITDSQRQEYTRLTNDKLGKTQKTPKLLLAMQRLGTKDPVSIMLDIRDNLIKGGSCTEKEFPFLEMPAIHYKPVKYIFPKSGLEYNAKQGEYLLAGTLSIERINELKLSMGVGIFECSMNQRPDQLALHGLLNKEMIAKANQHDFVNFNEKEIMQEMERIIIGVDPAVSINEKSDNTGLIVVGYGYDKKIYVLEDSSAKFDNASWNEEVARLYHKWDKPMVIAEVNQGGDMVSKNIQISINCKIN